MDNTVSRKKQRTYKDYLKLDNSICEVINGKFFMPPAPELLHQDVLRDLQYAVWQFVKTRQLGKIYTSPTDVKFDERNVVQPDLVFVAADNLDILKPKGIEGIPDLIIEIVSPASVFRDHHLKKSLYEKLKVKEYWIVDPANHVVVIFYLNKEEQYELHTFVTEEGTISSRLLDSLEIELEDIMCR